MEATQTTWFYMGVLAIWLILLLIYRRRGCALKCTLFTAVTGLLALGGLWLCGRFVAVPIGVTPLTLLISGSLGIPGTLWMLLFQLI